MTRITLGLIVICIALTSSAAELTVKDGWVRASIPGAPNGAAYFTLHNDSDRRISLIGLSTPVSETAELHTHRHEEGMMKMAHVPKLRLEPGETVTMQAGGYHVMLLGLKEPLKAATRIRVVLYFADDTTQTVELDVRDAQ